MAVIGHIIFHKAASCSQYSLALLFVYSRPCQRGCQVGFSENGLKRDRDDGIIKVIQAQEVLAVKIFTIDGNNFSNLEGFYNEIDKILTKDLNWKTEHTLDAYNDLLRGGFGVHEYEEPIVLRWINYIKSKRELRDDLILTILEITLDFNNSGHDCKLELY